MQPLDAVVYAVNLRIVRRVLQPRRVQVDRDHTLACMRELYSIAADTAEGIHYQIASAALGHVPC